MKVADIMPYILNSDRIIFRKDGEEIARGFKAILTMDEDSPLAAEMDKEVKTFRNYVDIKHKQWKEKGLMSPLMPEECEQYRFSDLMMSLYYIIEV